MKGLPKRTDQKSRTNNGGDSTTEAAVEDYRQGLVHDYICQEQSDQNPVLPLL